MAVKKVTSRTRSATAKQSKTTRSTTKRATKATKSRSAAKSARTERAPAEYTPAEHAPAAYTPAQYTPFVQRVEPAARATPQRPARSTGGDGPSRFTADHYLHATGPEPEEGSIRRPGKWLIFVSRSRIDALWADIRRAVEGGRLGHAARVTTALPHPESRDPKKHVVCVYTTNEDDPTDVRRVRDGLRALGVTWKIPYKSGAAARDQYEGTDGPAAKYYE